MGQYKPNLGSPIGRWAALGPYYAMFPLEFAFEVVEKYSKPGQLVIDPFTGRGSSIYAAATQERYGFGIEINPLGWVYAQVKLNPAPQRLVENRLKAIVRASESKKYQDQAKELPEFFKLCFAKDTRTFLLAARNNLNWNEDLVDRTLMSFILVYLHGKANQSLSNQMSLTKAMGPAYSVRWWKQHELKPPKIDIKTFLLTRIRWRYAKGIPEITHSKVIMGDSSILLKQEVETFSREIDKRCSLLFTSPPYYKLTDYHRDQWLRLWLLGGEEQPLWRSEKHTGRFNSQVAYTELLEIVFCNAAQIMDDSGTVYVRTDIRDFTKTTTLNTLRKYFPHWKETIIDAPVTGKTQTTIWGNKSNRTGEVDIILTKE
jgi:DNA modification methylase